MLMFLFLLFSVLLLRSFFRLKELFQVKNGLTTSLLFFFLKMLKIWVGQTTLNGEKKEDGLTLTKERRLVNRVRFESSMTPGSLAEVTGTRS